MVKGIQELPRQRRSFYWKVVGAKNKGLHDAPLELEAVVVVREGARDEEELELPR